MVTSCQLPHLLSRMKFWQVKIMVLLQYHHVDLFFNHCFSGRIDPSSPLHGPSTVSKETSYDITYSSSSRETFMYNGAKVRMRLFHELFIPTECVLMQPCSVTGVRYKKSEQKTNNSWKKRKGAGRQAGRHNILSHLATVQGVLRRCYFEKKKR